MRVFPKFGKASLTGNVKVCLAVLFGIAGCGGSPEVQTGPYQRAVLTVSDGPTYDFGLVLEEGVAEKTFTVSNVGAGTATAMNGKFSISGFAYKDGIYPGTGGTCATSLDPGANCQVVVTFTGIYGGDFNDYLRVTYYANGNQSTTSPTLHARVIAAPSGALDVSWNGTGVRVDNAFSRGRALAVQKDNKILVGGTYFDGNQNTFFVARYAPTGQPDTAFGSGGFAAFSFGTGNEKLNAIAVSPDGAIVAAGDATFGTATQVALARLKPDGTLDLAFGTNGLRLFPINAASSANGIAIQADGKILVGGSAENAGVENFMAARFNVDGSPDDSFAGQGFTLIPVGALTAAARGIAVDFAGGIVLGGDCQSDPGDHNFAAVRLSTTGTLDPSFGTGGIAIAALGGDDLAHAFAVAPDRSVVIVGESQNGWAILRLTANGVADQNFGVAGREVIFPGQNSSRATAVLIDAHGRLVVAGDANLTTQSTVVLRRLLANGTPDSSFGSGGDGESVLSALGAAEVSALAWQANGKILGVGGLDTAGLEIFRVWP